MKKLVCAAAVLVLLAGCKDKPVPVETVDTPVSSSAVVVETVDTPDTMIRINDLSNGSTFYDRLCNLIYSKNYSMTVVNKSIDKFNISYDVSCRSDSEGSVTYIDNIKFLDDTVLCDFFEVETRFVNKAFEKVQIIIVKQNNREWMHIVDSASQRYWTSESFSSAQFGRIFEDIFGKDLYPNELILAKSLYKDVCNDVKFSDVLYYRILDQMGDTADLILTETYDECYRWRASDSTHDINMNINGDIWSFDGVLEDGCDIHRTFEFKKFKPDTSYRKFKEIAVQPTWDETPDQAK